MPEAYRRRVAPSLPADWLTTAYPTAADLAALRAEAAGLAAARQLLQQAEQVRDQWHKLTTQEASKLQTWRGCGRNCRPTRRKSAGNTPAWNGGKGPGKEPERSSGRS